MDRIYSQEDLDFYYYRKERDLWRTANKRFEQGKLNIDRATVRSLKKFVELIRTLTNYDNWFKGTRTDKKYKLTNLGNDLVFMLGASKPCAKINKYTKEVEYFFTVEELAEDVMYCREHMPYLIKHRELRDGYYFCYAGDVNEILELL